MDKTGRTDEEPLPRPLAHPLDEQLRALHRDVLEQPVPQHLLDAGTRLERELQGFRSWTHWGGMAAMLLISFGLGWGLRPLWDPASTTPLAQQRSPDPAAGEARLFVRQAAAAHAVFSPEVRHPVEVGAADQQHLLQWLSKRLNRPLRLPSLSAQGYELVGGRLLPSEAGARAQFMYQNAAGQRLTLYVGALDATASPAAQETAFQFAADGPVNSFYWIDRGFGYALSAAVPRDTMQQVARVVYEQLLP